MAFSDLTAEQQATVNNLANMVRATAGEIARVCNHCRSIASGYVGDVETMLAGLSGSDVIPNASGLAGSQGLTKDELVNLIGYCIVVSDPTDNASGSVNTNYHRSLYAKAAGPGNLIG